MPSPRGAPKECSLGRLPRRAAQCYGAAVPTTVSVFVPLAELPVETPRPSAPPPGEEDAPAPSAGGAATPGDRERAVYSLALARAATAVGIPAARLGGGRILRKSLDARKGFPLGFQVQVEVFADHEQPPVTDGVYTVGRPSPSAPAPTGPVAGGRREPWTLLHGLGRLPAPTPVTKPGFDKKSGGSFEIPESNPGPSKGVKK